MHESPIFIHSLFRAGSTYLFNVFRRSEVGYWCYQEALHEIAVFCRENPSGLQEDHGEAKALLLRHPPIDGSYFKELLAVWPIWKNSIADQIVYSAYFSDQGEDIGIGYWRKLAEAARGRPVFQECRTAGRIGAIKRQMDSYHTYLWRNPWDQWWSYKVTPYFDVANQLIIHARNAPRAIRNLLTELGLPAYGRDDIAGAFAFYSEHPLTSEQSYLVFYLLWCLALREGMTHADLMLNIDRLSDSADYRSEMLAQLRNAGICGIDFADCRAPQGQYLEKDRTFFHGLEDKVCLWLKDGGWTQQDVDQVHALRQQYQPVSWNAAITRLASDDIVEQAARARQLARRLESDLAERTRSDKSKLVDLNHKARQAEAQTRQAEAQTRQAEAQTRQAEAKARQAEAKARQAEAKAQQAEARVQQMEEDRCSTRKELHDVHQANHCHWQLAEARQQTLQAIYSSLSWRTTAPLRFFVGLLIHPRATLRSGANHAIYHTIQSSQWLLSHLIAAVLLRPQLSYRINQFLMRYPALHQQLLGVARQQGVLPDVPHDPPPGGQIKQQIDLSLGHLSPHARQIYADLKAAIENNKRDS